MRDHVARRRFVDFEAERAAANFIEPRTHAAFRLAHCFFVRPARGLLVVLRLAEAAIIPAHQDLNLLRKDLRSKRKQLIAANLKLTETDAGKFWPVYDQYVTEQIAINDKKFGLIQDYADNWGRMTNEQSLLFSRQWLDMDIQTAQLRQKYVPIVSKVLDGKKTATFFQLDRRIAMMMELQVASQMPLVQEQAQ